MKIEFFEEDGDNSLSFENEHADFTVDVDPQSKTYESRMSLKDDVYYRTQRYEYRIKTNPIKVETRLVERKDEPPERYCVKDGVVLESDIRENNKFMSDEFIDGLKKEVEWNEDWAGNVVSMYVLSKHPEIVSPDDYRRYLRQYAEKIKSANQKVEKAIENDPLGLKVTDEYEGSGRTVWLSRAEQDKLSDDETKKAIEHQHKVKEKLFDEKSKDYVGISEGEFSSTEDILENIEAFLNKKPVTAKKQEGQKVGFGVKLGAFLIQWIWLFIVVSIALWLLSLVVVIIQYSFAFAFFASGILAFFLILLRSK